MNINYLCKLFNLFFTIVFNNKTHLIRMVALRIIIKKINHRELLLRLNDISTLEFACALIDKKGLNINKASLIFPVEFISSGTNHLSLNVVGIDGEIHPCRFRQLEDCFCFGTWDTPVTKKDK